MLGLRLALRANLFHTNAHEFVSHERTRRFIYIDNDEIEVENGKNDNNETVDHKQIRRSKRIKKRIVDINPDDIGENDNENDEDYK